MSYSDRYPALQTQQYRVTFSGSGNDANPALLELLGKAVRTVNLNLQRKFGSEQDDTIFAPTWYEVRTIGFGLAVPAQKDMLALIFKQLDAGLQLDVTITLCVGPVDLFTLSFEGVILKLAGDLNLGGFKEKDVMVAIVGIYKREIPKPQALTLNDGSVAYNYVVAEGDEQG